MTTLQSNARRRLTARAVVAVLAGRTAGRLSRLAGRGAGAVVGGRVALTVDPGLLRRLSAGHETVLISATNGKTTTTRLVAEALAAGGPVVSNHQGANMTPGIVAAFTANRGRRARFAALEVDEHYLILVAAQVSPRAITLLNLSRDQLDRAGETRMLAQRWRDGLGGLTTPTVYANADDPLVVWAAGLCSDVVWIAMGQMWKEDSRSCPACGGLLALGEDADWWCPACGFRRPEPAWSLDGEVLTAPDGQTHELLLRLPGRANRANAAAAVAVAGGFGFAPDLVLPRLAAVESVGGRYQSTRYRNGSVRLLLAKNPAGWLETFALAEGSATPVMLIVNAREPDGFDTSWLWDVDFRRLAGRPVAVTGERRFDLAVRLQADGIRFVLHDTAASAMDALTAPAASSGAGQDATVDVIANYTAFQQLRTEVGA